MNTMKRAKSNLNAYKCQNVNFVQGLTTRNSTKERKRTMQNHKKIKGPRSKEFYKTKKSKGLQVPESIIQVEDKRTST